MADGNGGSLKSPSESGTPAFGEQGSRELGEPAAISTAPEAVSRADGSAGLPLDPALVSGRDPHDDAEQIPELHEVDCPPAMREEIEQRMALYPDKRSASIPALWAVQRTYGWCTPEGIRQAAAVMGVTPAYLESVATFYDLLRTEPSGEHQVLVCTNISCWMRGGDELLEAFCRAAGADPHEAGHGGAVSADGKVLISGFECLGACDLAPMASVDERYFGPLETTDAATAVAQLRDGGDILPERALEQRGFAGGVDPDADRRADKVAAGDENGDQG